MEKQDFNSDNIDDYRMFDFRTLGTNEIEVSQQNYRSFPLSMIKQEGDSLLVEVYVEIFNWDYWIRNYSINKFKQAFFNTFTNLLTDDIEDNVEVSAGVFDEEERATLLTWNLKFPAPRSHEDVKKIILKSVDVILYRTRLQLEGKPKLADEEVVQFDYAIITALEEDEMERILDFIEVEGSVENSKHLIEYGSLKSNPTKKIVFASQQATGMIDASILATELVATYKPKYLIMAGVLGGKPKSVDIGDVVVATKVFTIDKGKISDLGFKKELEGSNVDSADITRFIRNKQKIRAFIKASDSTRKRSPDIHFGPIACVRQVIDLAGFFEGNISTEDRKAIALEMESYGIKRACDLVNNGKTVPLIIKAAMDNTVDKVDEAKSYAAWTSSKFVQYILENNLI